MVSNVDNLRTRLEGQLEVVEAAIDLHHRATVALKRVEWATDSTWWALIDDGDETNRAIEELNRVAPDSELLGVFERAQTEVRRAALRRLTERNQKPVEDETLSRTLNRLRRHACPMVEGTLSAEKSGDTAIGLSFAWLAVTGLPLGFLWLVLSAFGGFPLELGVLGVLIVLGPALAILSRSGKKSQRRFYVSAENLWLDPYAKPIALRSLVRVRMVHPTKGRCKVTWSFTNRPPLVCLLTDGAAQTLSDLLQEQGVKVESVGRQ